MMKNEIVSTLNKKFIDHVDISFWVDQLHIKIIDLRTQIFIKIRGRSRLVTRRSQDHTPNSILI
jgi:hypothetical protein